MAQSKGLRFLKKVIIVLMGGILAVVSPYALTFVILAMLPGVVAMCVDKGAHKYASNTVIVLNFVGVLPFLFEMWKSQEVGETAQRMIMDMSIWLFVYGAAAFGWVLIWGMPQMGAALLLARAEARVNKMRQMQQELVEEWGDKIIKDD